MNQYINLKSAKVDKKLVSFLSATKREFDTFFDFKIVDPLLCFVGSRQDLDLIVGRKTAKWFVGVSKNNSIYILNRKIFAKESNHNAKDFWQTLKHEYSHIYYTQISKSHHPFWLNEGLASYLSGKELLIKNSDQEKLLNVFDYFNKSDSDVYMVGQYWVEFLIKKYGKKKIVSLIKSLNIKSEISEKKFSFQFYKIYNFKFNKKSFAKFIE
ncbi:MAG: hypothetical protein WCV69_01185 [Patescibacteria group bacterium]|jgi:hypothetical protein